MNYEFLNPKINLSFLEDYITNSKNLVFETTISELTHNRLLKYAKTLNGNLCIDDILKFIAVNNSITKSHLISDFNIIRHFNGGLTVDRLGHRLYQNIKNFQNLNYLLQNLESKNFQLTDFIIKAETTQYVDSGLKIAGSFIFHCHVFEMPINPADLVYLKLSSVDFNKGIFIDKVKEYIFKTLNQNYYPPTDSFFCDIECGTIYDLEEKCQQLLAIDSKR